MALVGKEGIPMSSITARIETTVAEGTMAIGRGFLSWPSMALTRPSLEQHNGLTRGARVDAGQLAAGECMSAMVAGLRCEVEARTRFVFHIWPVQFVLSAIPATDFCMRPTTPGVYIRSC